MEYVIGIDGGGTRSRLAIADQTGALVWKTEGESTNRYSVSESDVRNAYRDLFSNAFQKIDPADLKSICIGSAGLSRPVEKKMVLQMLSDIVPEHTRIKLVNDCELLLSGALPDSYGIALISGTGSICYGLDENGKMVRSGGLGWRLGDEGSAWHMADQAVRLVLRSEDGRGVCSKEVRKSVLEYFQAEDPSELIPILNDKELEKSFVARLAPRISRLAEKGDETALRIIDEEVEELYSLILSCYRKLFSKEKVDLVLAGGVMEHDMFVKDRLLKVLEERLPDVKPVDSVGTALDGAVKLALQNMNI